MSKSTRHAVRRRRVVDWTLIAGVAAGFSLGVYAAGIASPWINDNQWLMPLFLGFGAVFSLILGRIRRMSRIVLAVVMCAGAIRIASLVSQRIEFEQRRWLVETLRARILSDQLKAERSRAESAVTH